MHEMRRGNVGSPSGGSVQSGSTPEAALSSRRVCSRRNATGHKDSQAAMVAGRLPEVARVSHLLTKAAQEKQQLIQQQSLMLSAGANSVR